MKKEEILKRQLDLCEKLYSVLLEENSFLKREGRLPDEDILEKKRDFLPRLDDSLKALKGLEKEPSKLDLGERRVIQVTQKKLMKIFLLDRENEKLLLKAAVPVKVSNPRKNAPADRFGAVYES